MTPTEFRDCLALMHWSQRGFAAIIGKDERQVRRWAAGQGEIPDDIANWLALIATAMRTNPPPAMQ